MKRKCTFCDHIAAERKRIRLDAARNRAIQWGKEQGYKQVALYITSEGAYEWAEAGVATAGKHLDNLTVPA